MKKSKPLSKKKQQKAAKLADKKFQSYLKEVISQEKKVNDLP